MKLILKTLVDGFGYEGGCPPVPDRRSSRYPAESGIEWLSRLEQTLDGELDQRGNGQADDRDCQKR